MSSHREAPEIAKDPVADSTDLYAFVSPDRPETVTIIANYVPLQGADGGPNFYEFGDDVQYAINIDNNGDGKADVSYVFEFTTRVRNDETFLYNTGPIQSLDSANWNRRQFYSVTKRVGTTSTVIAHGLSSPPCNIGPLSTPNYAALAANAVHGMSNGTKVFAGQRAEGFYVDLGATFDLLDPRPLANLHTTFGLTGLPGRQGPGVNSTRFVNVHTIALQVPKTELTKGGKVPTDAAASSSVIGVWTTASRRQVTIRQPGKDAASGPWVQVSRLGNPLFNEVIVPMSEKDLWNATPPTADNDFAKYVAKPELAGLLPVLFPGVFPKLAAYTKPRADLLAILLTGIPSGIIPGFQNFTGSTQADLLRLNLAIPPSSSPSIYGLLGGDLAGFPNGRRPADDVVAIELRAVAGATIPLVDPSFTPDGAAAIVDDGVGPDSLLVPFLRAFPYLGVPHSGFFAGAA
ncbi:MAG: DUF4331 domain-containing protein [Actinomycetales bacterium]